MGRSIAESSRLGVDAYKAGQYQGAFDRFKEVLDKSESGNVPASLFYNLGSAVMQLGNIAEAIPYLEQAVSLVLRSGTIQEVEKYKNKLVACQALSVVGAKGSSPKK